MADRLRGKRRAIITAIVLIVVLGVGGSAWALAGGGGASYRTTTVTRGDVAQVLTTTGTISPVRSADVDFQVAGKVAKIFVKQGTKVKVGQKLAALNQASLRYALRSARSTLNDARSQLVADENSQTSAASTTNQQTSTQSSSPAPTASPKSSTPPKTSQSPSPTGGTVSKQLLAKIQRDQATLVADQQQADADLATAKDDLKAETTACAAELSGSGDADSTDDTTACVNATQTLLADQQAVSADQQAVAKDETALNKDLTTALGSLSPTPSPTQNEDTVWSAASSASTAKSAVSTSSAMVTDADATTPPTGTTSTPSNSGSTYTGGSSTVTASTLASDQAKIDSDRASVATARADLTQATLRAPISGKVAAITIAKGDAASGSGGDTPAIKIVGSRQAKVTIDLAPAQVRELKTGMAAKVTADGTSTQLAGTVAMIGQAATDSSTGDTTYPVTITLTSRPTNLVSGAEAQVAVTLSQLTNVVVVPTSAVHHNGKQTYVETATGGTTKRVSVTVGAVGAAVTQIKSGLKIGQEVVLADLNAAVPSSSTNLTNRGGLGGGLGGSGFSGRGPTFSRSFPAPPSGATFGGR